MADAALDFDAYRRARRALESADEPILRLRALVATGLAPEEDQAAIFAALVGELETAPEIEEVRHALGRTTPANSLLDLVAMIREEPPGSPEPGPDAQG